MNERNPRICRQTFMVLGILLVLVLGAYSNTFKASWQLDDYPTIVDNPRLHLKDLLPNSLAATFYSRPAALGNTYRPVSCLSLALNWYFGGNRVAGYHVVNVGIHLLTAFFLYFTIFSLLRSPRLAEKYGRHAFTVALLSAVLWALNPVQTQAVTYIVQRMAALAAMFYILSLYFYVKARTVRARWQQLLCFAAVGVCYAMAVWSKENAIVLPLALILSEIVFFQNLDSAKINYRVRALAGAIGLFLLAGLLYTVYFSNDIAILNGYQHRAFTLGQRLLTEPRIVVFYLGLLFYPMPQRLSIEHAVQVSTSLFEPWTTLPALALVVFLVVMAIYQVKKRPLLAFALLFYFLNHLVESTVLPLELIFEHRNYLPSLFLFCPVSAWLLVLVDDFQEKSAVISKILVIFIVMLVLGLGVSTYIRNSAWATETTLWLDAMRKAPDRARATYNLAKQYTRSGHLDAAEALYRKALNQDASRPKYTRALALNGIASIYFKKGDFKRALEYCAKALEVKPDFNSARKNLVLVLAQLNQWDRVAEQIDLQLNRRKNSKVYQFLKGELLLKQNQPAEALVHLRKALKSAPHDKKILLNIGIALKRMNQIRQAEWFLNRVKKEWPNDIRPYIHLIGLGLNSENSAKTERYLDDLLTRFTLNRLNIEQPHCLDEVGLTDASRKLICQVVNDKIILLADDMIRKGKR